MPRALGLALFACSLAAAVACERAPDADSRLAALHTQSGPEVVPGKATGPAKSGPSTPVAAATNTEESERCAVEWRRVEALPALPGAPGFEQRRVEILGRARAEPVAFERAPSDVPSPEVARLRTLLEKAPSPAEGVSRVLSATRRNFALRRQALLREGYLYAESPVLASVLAGSLRLEHLFDEPEIVLERGAVVRRLVRVSGRYFDAVSVGEGAAAARTKAEASLFLLDRVSLPDAVRQTPLHFSVREVAEAAGASSLTVERVTAEGLLVTLDYAGVKVRAVLDRAGASTSLRCQESKPELQARVEAARELDRRRRKAFLPMRSAIDDMVDEQLPFDEPKTEDGQQDGKLRPAWREAYFKGDKHYEFNGDEYAVFDGLGRPRVPQVCVDFITDVFERASGAWWSPRGQGRKRAPGRISFRSLGIENSRSVESLLDFAQATPEWFDVSLSADHERVPFRKRQEFFAKIASSPDGYQLGDVVFIYGLRDDDKPHYHSFFVYDRDPLSGAPILVAANAGRPRVRSWEGEMQNAPRRSIVARLRPRLEFLEALIAGERPLTAPARQPLASAVEPNAGSR